MTQEEASVYVSHMTQEEASVYVSFEPRYIADAKPAGSWLLPSTSHNCDVAQGPALARMQQPERGFKTYLNLCGCWVSG